MSKYSLGPKCNCVTHLKRRAWSQTEVGHQRAPKLQWSDSLFFIHDDDDNVKQSNVKLVHIAELLKKTFSAILHAAMYRNDARHDMFDGIGLGTQGHWTE